MVILHGSSRPRAAAAITALVVLAAGCAPTSLEDNTQPTSPAAPPAASAVPSKAAGAASEVLAGIAAMDLAGDALLTYLEERATDEGELVLYSSGNEELSEALVTAFRTDHPTVEVGVVNLSALDALTRIRAEESVDRPMADVVMSTAPILAGLVNDGLLAAHHGMIVPDDHPEEFVEDFSGTFLITPQVIPRRVSDGPSAPQDWDDFLLPAHAGCVLSESPTWVAVLAQDRGADAMERWFASFLANEGQMARSSGTQVRRLLAGEIECTVHANIKNVADLIDSGAPLAWSAPDPTPATSHSLAVLGSSGRPHAAALFIRWVVGPRGAQIAADLGHLPTHPSARIRESLQVWTDPLSPERRRMRYLRVHEALELEEVANDLLARYHTPNIIP